MTVAIVVYKGLIPVVGRILTFGGINAVNEINSLIAQIERNMNALAPMIELNGMKPVSYTHLGLYGNFTLELKKKLKDYSSSVGVKKIICTYDKIDKLTAFINPKDLKLTIDEYHNFLKQYSFRDKAINGVLAHFKEFKSYCFLSEIGRAHV